MPPIPVTDATARFPQAAEPHLCAGRRGPRLELAVEIAMRHAFLGGSGWSCRGRGHFAFQDVVRLAVVAVEDGPLGFQRLIAEPGFGVFDRRGD